MQRERDTAAAPRLLRRLLPSQPVEPEATTTEGLKSYPAAFDELGLRHLRRPPARWSVSAVGAAASPLYGF
jgi:putative transposase